MRKNKKWAVKSGCKNLAGWSLTGSKGNITCFRGDTQTLSKWTGGLAEFVQRNSPCQIVFRSDFLSDDSHDVNEAIAIAGKLGSELFEIDADEFKREKERILNDPQMQSWIEKTVEQASRDLTAGQPDKDETIERTWEELRDELRSRGAEIGDMLLPPVAGSLAYDFFQNSERQGGWPDGTMRALENVPSTAVTIVEDDNDGWLAIFRDSTGLYLNLPRADVDSQDTICQQTDNYLKEFCEQLSATIPVAKERQIAILPGPKTTVRLHEWVLFGGSGGQQAQKILNLFATSATTVPTVEAACASKSSEAA